MLQVEFDDIVRSALQRIPLPFRDAMVNVEIIVEDWPDPDLMKEVVRDGDAFLYGLFWGTPLTEQSFGDWGAPPSVIYLYRKPLEQDFPDRRDLEREVEITLVHEIAHYMGFDEDQLEEYGYD